MFWAPLFAAALTLLELQKKEITQDRDPLLKLQLGDALWCANRRAEAIESWLWILHFAPESAESGMARERTKKARQNSDTLISEFNCPKL
jgi:hypothetical protein